LKEVDGYLVTLFFYIWGITKYSRLITYSQYFDSFFYYFFGKNYFSILLLKIIHKIHKIYIRGTSKI